MSVVKSIARVSLVALSGTALLGCVSKDDYIAQENRADWLTDQLAAAQAAAESNEQLVKAYQAQIARAQTARHAETAMAGNYEEQIAALISDRDQLAARYEDLLRKIGTGPALPEALSSELSSFAASNPDLVEFDADEGVVKFKSDVTFNSGDAVLTRDAAGAIDRFAQILNGPIARSYELRVAGHTDNVGNFSAVTIQKGHKNNWYLSSHRAIAVADRLMGQGVNKTRIGVLGFADQRPAASNQTAAGRAQNRRVEVLILPSTAGNSTESAAVEAAPSPAPAAATVQPEPRQADEDDSHVMK
jgi:flagellar motor protein MotB